MESSIHRNLVRKLTSLKINESFRKENVSVSFEVQTLEILGACAIHHLYEKFKNVKKKIPAIVSTNAYFISYKGIPTI